MGLSDWLLPARLPRQVVYAGDRHGEIVTLAGRRIVQRQRVDIPLADPGGADGWAEIVARLLPVDTGIILNSEPFIFNFFEFDKLPWSRQLLRELVEWKLQKIFPEEIAAYDHRFFRLNKKRIFSILVKKSLLADIEARFGERSIPLIFIGNSALEIFNRLTERKPVPDFFVEVDVSSCCLVFQDRGAPVYVRKFKGGSHSGDLAAEIVKTVQFVRSNGGRDPRRFELIDHRQGVVAGELIGELAQEGLSCPDAARAMPAPYIPGCL
ncbi:MAG: hypothetical protein NTW95_14505 [Candidatus Aminicenantes bacterium]|nr:hypothetical protein [Candidatus Aminicenantes bacterium]